MNSSIKIDSKVKWTVKKDVLHGTAVALIPAGEKPIDAVADKTVFTRNSLKFLGAPEDLKERTYESWMVVRIVAGRIRVLEWPVSVEVDS